MRLAAMKRQVRHDQAAGELSLDGRHHVLSDRKPNPPATSGGCAESAGLAQAFIQKGS